MASAFEEPLLPGEIEERLIRGFVPSATVLAHGPRKRLAVKIRARCHAVDSALRKGISTPLREVADCINVTERNLRMHFRHKDDLFAFPPPEMATALATMTTNATSWAHIRERTGELLGDLEQNTHGRLLLLNLVELHQREKQLGASDNHFAHELRSQLSCIASPFHGRSVVWASVFTDRFRDSLIEWSRSPDMPLTSVLEHICGSVEPTFENSRTTPSTELANEVDSGKPTPTSTEIERKLKHS